MIPRKTVVESISCMQTELDLIDVWKMKNFDTKIYTWTKSKIAKRILSS